MDCETNDCEKEKRGCKGCYYDKLITNYTLQFKYVKEDRYLYYPISSTSLNDAIKEAEEFIEFTEKREGKVEKAYLNSTRIEKERAWERRINNDN